MYVPVLKLLYAASQCTCVYFHWCLWRAYWNPIQTPLPTSLTWADSEHPAIDKRSQLRQGSGPRNSIHFEHRPEVIHKLKKALVTRENNSGSGSPQPDITTSAVCSDTPWHMKNKDQRKPSTFCSAISQVLKLTDEECKSTCKVSPLGKQTCFHEWKS